MLRIKQLPKHVSSRTKLTFTVTNIPDTTLYKKKGLYSVDKYNPQTYLYRTKSTLKAKRDESPFYDYCIRIKSPFQKNYHNKSLNNQGIYPVEKLELIGKDNKFDPHKTHTEAVANFVTDRNPSKYAKTTMKLGKGEFSTPVLPKLGKEKSRLKWKKLSKCTLFNFEIDASNNTVSLVRMKLPDAEEDIKERVKVKTKKEGKSLSSEVQKKKGIEGRPRRTSIKVHYGVGEESPYRTLDSFEPKVQNECKKILLKNKLKGNLKTGIKLRKLLKQDPSETVFDLNTLNISKVNPTNHLYIYLAIKKAVLPTFYNTENNELNTIDPEIIEAIDNKIELTDYDKDLIELYKKYIKKVSEGKVAAGFWQVMKAYGYRPICRESPTLATIGNKLFLFGGYGVDKLNDLWCLSVDEHNKHMWNNVLPYNSHIPEKRYGHSMTAHNNDLYVFGGSSEFLTGLKTRVVLGDLWKYSVERNQWIEIDTSRYNYKNRMYAASCALYGLWAIHGGIDGDHKNVLSSIIGYHFGTSPTEA